MSNLLGHVFSIIFFIPTILFGFDLVLIQSISSELEVYATTIMIRASHLGLTEAMIVEVENEGYLIECVNGCQSPQVGQTQNFVMMKTYTPLFISKDNFNVVTKRSYIIGYY